MEGETFPSNNPKFLSNDIHQEMMRGRALYDFTTPFTHHFLRHSSIDFPLQTFLSLDIPSIYF
jgi:hypothetical protein